jgi:GNAT superfamily N-acetyltransferase
MHVADVSVTTPDRLDFAEFVRLQRDAFAAVIGGTGMADILSEPYYRWKYTTPEGQARIALVREEGRLVAANAMYPLRVRHAGTSIRVWQSCDTATHPDARRRGYFMKCLAALRDELDPGEIFFGFPNKNSSPGFLSFGWTPRGDVPTWARVFPGRRTEGATGIAEVAAFGAEQDELAARLAALGRPLLDRSAAYMSWRYLQHPLNAYTAYAYTDGGSRSGVVVLRELELNGRRLAIAMELQAVDRSAERKLMAFAAAWARSRRVRFTLIMDNAMRIRSGARSGFLPIPQRLLPKRQVLMGMTTGGAADDVWGRKWHVQTGDWDGF